MPAFIADNLYRQRDPRYADQDHHKDKASPLHDKSPQQAKHKLFGVSDFCRDEEAGPYTDDDIVKTSPKSADKV